MAGLTTQEKGSVRMGPITLMSLVIILSLSVLAVLSITTARVDFSQAQRQAESITSTYANERAAQAFLADVDLILAQVAQNEGSLENAMEQLTNTVPGVAKISGNTVRIAYSTHSGRVLNIGLQINEDLTYTITKWKATVQWDSANAETSGLWSGM